MSQEPVQTRICRNCEADLVDRFCQRCGQEDQGAPETTRGFLKELAIHGLNLDSKAAQTVRALLFHPGELTRAWLAGQRARYAQPVWIYVIAAVALLLVQAYSPFVRFNTETRAVSSSLSVVSVGFELTEQWLAGLQSRGISIEIFHDRFAAVVSGLLPVLLLATILLFAVGLAVLYRRSRMKPVGHVIFALHYGAFYFGLTTLDQLLPIIGIRGLALPAVFSILAYVYLIVSSRRVYRQAWFWTILKSAVLMIAFFFLLAGWLLSTTQIARASL